MRRVVVRIVAVCLLALLGLGAAPRAHAATNTITRLDVDVTVAASGLLTVTQSVDITFAKPSTSTSIELHLPLGRVYDQASDQVFTYTVVSVTSPTGASTFVSTRELGAGAQGFWLATIGNGNTPLTGTQSYVITYTVAGAIVPAANPASLDELSLTVGADIDWLIASHTTLRVHGPTDFATVECKATAPACTSQRASASDVTFTRGGILAATVRWAAGTFPSTSLHLAPHVTSHNQGVLEVDATLNATGRLDVTQRWTIAYTSQGPWDQWGDQVTWFDSLVPYDKNRALGVTYSSITVTRPDGTVVPSRLENNGYGARGLTISDPTAAAGDQRTYIVHYVASGLVAPGADGSGTLTWPVVESSGVELASITARLHAPTTPSDVTCRTGPYVWDTCDYRTDGADTAVFTLTPGTYSSSLSRRDWTLTATWPAGTFPGVPSTLRITEHNLFDITYTGRPFGIGALVATLAGAAVLWGLHRRDQARGWTATVGGRPLPTTQRNLSPDLRDRPPDGVPVRLADFTITRPPADGVTATLVDLAARGYLTMRQDGEAFSFHRTDWTTASLDGFEQQVLLTMFAHDRDTSTEDLSRTDFPSRWTALTTTHTREMLAQPWSPLPALRQATIYRGVAWLFLALGAPAVFIVAWILAFRGLIGLAWPALPFVVGGVCLLWMAHQIRVSARDRGATVVQLRGFQRFLESTDDTAHVRATKRAHFSSFLPWAIAFGYVDQWCRSCAPADGDDAPAAAWFSGGDPLDPDTWTVRLPAALVGSEHTS